MAPEHVPNHGKVGKGPSRSPTPPVASDSRTRAGESKPRGKKTTVRAPVDLKGATLPDARAELGNEGAREQVLRVVERVKGLKSKLHAIQKELKNQLGLASVSLDDLKAFQGHRFENFDQADAFAELTRTVLRATNAALICNKHGIPSSLIRTKSTERGQFQFSHLDQKRKACGGGAAVPTFRVSERLALKVKLIVT